jgi:hypothetical protein
MPGYTTRPRNHHCRTRQRRTQSRPSRGGFCVCGIAQRHHARDLALELDPEALVHRVHHHRVNQAAQGPVPHRCRARRSGSRGCVSRQLSPDPAPEAARRPRRPNRALPGCWPPQREIPAESRPRHADVAHPEGFPNVQPRLSLEPNVFETPAIVEAVHHGGQSLHPRVPAGRGAIVRNDRPHAIQL